MTTLVVTNKDSKHSIALINGYIVKEEGVQEEPPVYVTANRLQSSLMSVGYLMDEPSYQYAASKGFEWILSFWLEVQEAISEVIGDKHEYKPLIQNFSQGVERPSDNLLPQELYVDYDSIDVEESKNLTLLRLITEEEFKNIFTSLVGLNQDLAPREVEIVKWFITNYEPEELILPEVIPFKQTLCMLAAEMFPVKLDTPTDLLRVALYMSEADMSMPKVPKKLRKASKTLRKKYLFRKFSKKERRFLLSLLETTHANPEEMALKSELWKRLAEIIHPGDYKNKYPKAAEAFDLVMNKKVRTWESKLNQKFTESFQEGLKELAKKPGQFARRLDSLVRSEKRDIFEICDIFKNEIVHKVSNRVLYQLYAHFNRRADVGTNRKITFKRKVIDLKAIPSVDPEAVARILQAIELTLYTRFSELDPLGKVYIDPQLDEVFIPRDMKELSYSAKPMVRGQRLPFSNPNAKVIRAYVHWYNDGSRRCDIDLSAVLIGNENPKHIGWDSNKWYIKEEEVLAAYSGDVTNRLGPCAEYVDIDVKKCLDAGYRYVVVDARDYVRGQGGLSTYKDCIFGIMEREAPEASKVFKPSTVSNAFTLSSTAVGVIAGALDLLTKEWFLIDIDTQNSISSLSLKEVVSVLEQVTKPASFTVKQLLRLHAKARGSLVASPEDADIVFNKRDFLTNYTEISKWMGV